MDATAIRKLVHYSSVILISLTTERKLHSLCILCVLHSHRTGGIILLAYCIPVALCNIYIKYSSLKEIFLVKKYICIVMNKNIS